MKRLGYVLAVLLAVVVVGFAFYKLSPWPSVLLIRHAFEKGDAASADALRKHVPAGVTTVADQRFGEAKDAVLDVFLPPGLAGTTERRPVVVWVHGGGFVGGHRSKIADYLKVLAARDFVTVSVGYTLAPSAKYPTPVAQTHEALAWVVANADRLNVDPNRIFLAGDSAGAQIAAQTAATLSDPAYARTVGVTPSIERAQLAGVVLFCGIFDASKMNLEGDFGWFNRTTMWAYFGDRSPGDDPRLAEFSVVNHVTPKFPPAFISAGDADPLGPQSVALAQALTAQGVSVDALFFPEGHDPPLPHEYQFNLDGEAGRLALDRLTVFLNADGGSPSKPGPV